MDRNYNLNLRWEMLILADRVDRGRRELKERRRNRAFMSRNVDPLVSLPDSEFVRTFRLSKHVVKEIAADLTPLIAKERRQDGISVMMKVRSRL